jgi:predicted house-cleaning noncanonical NTP pyrophosphatase (MazG superfamily)
LKDQIFKTAEKYFLCLSLDDMLEDFKENLEGKNVEKQAHVLELVFLMLKKSNLVDN